MSLVNFSSLDFQQIRTQIKDYLRANSTFSDYDFEGSNLSILIDTLAYNTYINSFNANMISNEVFIDSATLRENVVSLARNIGYVPRSRIASRASVSFLVNFEGQTNVPVTVTLRKGLAFISASSIGQNTYTFVIPDDITINVINNIALFENIEIFEGVLIQESFTYNPNVQDPRIVLGNVNIDTSTINAFVRNSSFDVGGDRYKLVNNLFEAKATANVFFIQEIVDQKYELIFGDGIFGKKLSAGNVIDVSYVVTNGPSGNGVNSFTFAGRLEDNNGISIISGISPIETVSKSVFGEEIESVDSVKKYSTKIYSAQNRAVTSADYEALIPFVYPEASIVSAYGGETLNPPEYGKVFVAIKPKRGQFLSDIDKRNLITNLRSYSVVGVDIEVVDMKFLYVEFDSYVYYDSNKASSPNAIKSIIMDTLKKYGESSELNGVGTRFKFSKFQKIIDSSHKSITSNLTNIQIRRNIVATLNTVSTYEICFGNPFAILNGERGYNIRSSGFTMDGIDGTLYLGDIPNDDGNSGKVVAIKLTGRNQTAVVREVGRIDYQVGDIYLYNINFESTSKTLDGQPIIEISAVPQSNDVIGLQDLYLQLSVDNSSVNMIVDKISSGADTSGSTYIRSSSYFDFDAAVTR